MSDLEEGYDAKTNKIRHPKDKKAYVQAYKSYFDGRTNYKASDKHGHLKFFNHLGMDSAMKHAGLNEEVEHLDELSKQTLNKYIDRASNDRTRHLSNPEKYFKRMEGTSLAVKKVVKKTDLGEEFIEEKMIHVGTYTNNHGAKVTLHRADHDNYHHVVVHDGKVQMSLHASTDQVHKKLNFDGFKGALHEMYHGGTAGYQQAKKGDNIHHGVVMVHGVDGNRKVKKIHWADTATFNGQVAVPAGASKNEQVRKAKREGWRVDHHVASTSHDTVKSSLDNHHKRIKANDAMLRAGAARRKKLQEMEQKEISREDYELIREMHAEAELPFFHNEMIAESEGSTALITFSHDIHGIPTIKLDRSQGKYYVFQDKNLSEGVEEDAEKFADQLVQDLEHVEFQRRMRRQVHEDHPSGNWFVQHSGTRVSGPHPSEEQAIIYRDLYVTNNNTPLSEMSIERTDVVNEEEQLDELSTDTTQMYTRKAVRQWRNNKHDPEWMIKKGRKRDKMIDLACKKTTNTDCKVPAKDKWQKKLSEENLLQNASFRSYAKKNKEEEDKIASDLDAAGKAGATDPAAEEENKKMTGVHESAARRYGDAWHKKTYRNTPENAKKIGWDRVPEYVSGDKNHPYVEHDHKKGTFTYTPHRGNLREDIEDLEESVDPVAAREFLNKHKARNVSYFSLDTDTTNALVAHAKESGYRKSKHAPGSLGRMYHNHLNRLADKADKWRNERLKEDYSVEDLEEGRRGRPPKSGAQVAGDEPNIIMSLRKAHYSTVGHKVQFKDGSHHVVSSEHASKILNHFNGLKPHEKEQFQAHISQGVEHLTNWSAFHPQDHKRSVPAEKSDRSIGARTVKKANRVPDRTEMIRRIAAKIKAQKEAK